MCFCFVLQMVRGCWWYYFSKFTEFLDTVSLKRKKNHINSLICEICLQIFFVLRKKNDHISTLHVIHHGIMPLSVWFGVKFTPGGHSTFFGFLNTFVHIIMYSYYLIAALGPQYQKYIWWKKYLTALQMVQFVLVMVHAFQLLFIDCNYPKAFIWWIGMHAVMFYFLFSNFYKQTYVKKRNEKLKQQQNGSATMNKVKKSVNICFPPQNALYDTSKTSVNGYKESYISEQNVRLRNNVFIDKRDTA